MGTRALIYTRISADSEGDGLGVARQEADCRALAAQLEAEVIDVYTDNDRSAFSGRVRERYLDLLDDLRHGVGDLVIAWHPDRLHRRPAELIEFIDICKANTIDVRTVKAGEWDPSPSGRAVAITLAAWAEYESGHKSERIRRKHEELAMAGKSSGGPRPYGFEPDRVTLRADEAEVIKEAMRRALAGESLVALARDLNERGITTATGKLWRTHILKGTLCSARIAGWREHTPGSKHGAGVLGGPFTAEAEWPAIVAREDVERLRAKLAANRRMGPPRRYLLSGILRCGQCGQPMSATGRGDGKSRYACTKQSDGSASGCGKVSVLVDPADDLITEGLAERLADRRFLARLRETEASDPDGSLGQQLGHDEAALVELGQDRDDGIITRAEWLARRARITDRMDRTRRALNRRSRLAALDGFTDADTFDQAWGNAGRDKRRAVLDAVLESVTLHPAQHGARFDPDRFHPQWRA